MAHGTSDRCPGCRALISGGRAQGHSEECRIRVEGESRKTEEEKARLRAAASRVGDALTGRALKRVRFAEDQDDNNAEVPEPTSESASSNPPAKAAHTFSQSCTACASTCVCNHRVAGAVIADEWVQLCATGVWLRCVALAASLECSACGRFFFAFMTGDQCCVWKDHIHSQFFVFLIFFCRGCCFFAGWVLVHVWHLA